MKNHITENACAVYVSEQEYVDLKCDGFFSYEEVVGITEHVYDMLRYYNVKKCIINLQQVKIYPSGAEEYLRDVWYNKLLQTSLSRIAYVVPEDVFGRTSMIVVHAGSAVKKIQREYFTDEASAKEWLNS